MQIQPGSKFSIRSTLNKHITILSQTPDGSSVVFANQDFAQALPGMGIRIPVLTSIEVMSVENLIKDYVEFDSPEFHSIMKTNRKRVLFLCD